MYWLVVAVVFVITSVISFLAALLAAQLVVFGLSIMHINTGLWGPLLILGGITMVVGTNGSLNKSRK